ncbi:hypothetical protein [Jannaschia seosinensis]|nr:hypothetical protein [Jannaschia seosinensis]
MNMSFSGLACAQAISLLKKAGTASSLALPEWKDPTTEIGAAL